MKKSLLRAALLGPVALGLLIQGCTFKSKTDSRAALHFAKSAKIKGLDPIYADDALTAEEVGRAYEGLLQYHYLKRPFTVVPNLADGMPEVSADRMTYTFKIKKGTLFHDDPCFKATQKKGREVTAEDFVYSLRRLADPALHASGWWLLDGKIAGLNEWREQAIASGKADYTKAIEGLIAPDPYVLKIKLTRPWDQFLYVLAMPFTVVLPKEAVDEYGSQLMRHEVGTGPFVLSEYVPRTRITWSRNPTYRKEAYPSEGEPSDRTQGLLADAGKSLPLSEKVMVRILEDSRTLWSQFISGQLDLIEIPKENLKDVLTPSKDLSPTYRQKGLRLAKYPKTDVTYIAFNMSDPLLGKNKNLRHALNLAYDVDQAIELFYGGIALPAQGPIPPGIAEYDSAFKNPYRRFNLAKAKELLAQAGFPGGKGLPELEYLSPSDASSQSETEYVKKMFSALGVSLKVKTFSWPEFLTAVKEGRGQLWSFAWTADYPDADNFFQLFYSKNAAPGGPNDSRYSNSEFDQLYEKFRAQNPGSERTALARKMTDILAEDCPWILGVHRVGLELFHDWIKNFKPNDSDYGSSKYLRVDTSLRHDQ